MPPDIVGPEVGGLLDWIGVSDAIAAGHRLPRATIGDTFLYRNTDTLLSRAAWVDGLGSAVKTALIFPGNRERGLPAVNGGLCLYSDTDGTLEALVDFHLVTRWKTAADSLLAARLLAPPRVAEITILGAGAVAGTMAEAYRAAFPDARLTFWNRTPEAAARLAARFDRAGATRDAAAAVTCADIVATATMATEPVLHGDWLRPGQHVDLIGAYRPDMREADDAALARATLFVDSFDTTLDHIGELKRPMDAGNLSRDAVRADFYDLPSGGFARPGPEAITICKNGGGAHLDLMVARHIQSVWRARSGGTASPGA